MGLDSFIKILITVPEHQTANFDPQIISDIKYSINSIQDSFQEHTELALADKLSLRNDTFVVNPRNDHYDTPLFEIVPNDDDYLARRYWNLANHIVNYTSTPVLKKADLENTAYRDPKSNLSKNDFNYHTFLNTTSNYLNITDNLDQIHQFLKNDRENASVAHDVNQKLNYLEKYLNGIKPVLKQYENNLKIAIVYYEWF